MHEEDDNDESTMIRRGKRKRAKNSRYFNKDTVNTIISKGGIKIKKPLDMNNPTKEMRKMWLLKLWNIF